MLHGSQKINEGVCERKLEVTIWWFWENPFFLLSLHLSFIVVRKFTNRLRTKVKPSCLANKKVFSLKKQKFEEGTILERLWSKLYKNGFVHKKNLFTLQLHCKLLKSFINLVIEFVECMQNAGLSSSLEHELGGHEVSRSCCLLRLAISLSLYLF